MTNNPIFTRAQPALARAAAKGVADAAEALADRLRQAGETARVEIRADGSAAVTLEGAAAVSRQFGTPASPARPQLSPALHGRPR